MSWRRSSVIPPPAESPVWFHFVLVKQTNQRPYMQQNKCRQRDPWKALCRQGPGVLGWSNYTHPSTREHLQALGLWLQGRSQRAPAWSNVRSLVMMFSSLGRWKYHRDFKERAETRAYPRVHINTACAEKYIQIQPRAQHPHNYTYTDTQFGWPRHSKATKLIQN